MIGKGTTTAEQTGTCIDYEFCIDADNDNKCTTIDKHLKNSVYAVKEDEVSKLVVDCLSGAKLKKGEKAMFIIDLEWYPESSDESSARTVTGQIYGTVR